MTNADIILSNSIFLMNEGLLESTGELTTFDGQQVEIPEAIHTYNEWKKLGFVVKKGEHAIAKFPIWQLSGKKKKADDEEEEDDKKKAKKFYMKTAHFFKAAQVEPIR